MAGIEIYRTAVFLHEDHAHALHGNPATVALLPVRPDAGALRRVLDHCGPVTCCVMWPAREALQVRCFGAGEPIRFCGHGLLAAANIWRERAPGREYMTLRTATGRYTALQEENQLWLRAPRRRCRAVTPPPTSAQWFDRAPCASALAGDAQGYRILEWPAGTDLATLQPDLDAIARSGGRSVIATQAHSGDEWDFTLRYFAPQYGAPEDGATGSANAVLADYWHGRGLERKSQARPYYVARQCSPRGGVVLSRLRDEFVDIGGGFQIIEQARYRNSADIG
jgi:predicted PhzF superfamily epimerase YddE/YHI9